MVVEGHQGPAVINGGQQQHHVAVEHNQVQHELGDTKVEALGEGEGPLLVKPIWIQLLQTATASLHFTHLPHSPPYPPFLSLIFLLFSLSHPSPSLSLSPPPHNVQHNVVAGHCRHHFHGHVPELHQVHKRVVRVLKRRDDVLLERLQALELGRTLRSTGGRGEGEGSRGRTCSETMRGSKVIAGLYLLELDQSACACMRHRQQHQRTPHNHTTPHHTQTPHTHTPHTDTTHTHTHTPHTHTPHTDTTHTHTTHTTHHNPNRKCLYRQTGDWLLGAACVMTCSTLVRGAFRGGCTGGGLDKRALCQNNYSCTSRHAQHSSPTPPRPAPPCSCILLLSHSPPPLKDALALNTQRVTYSRDNKMAAPQAPAHWALTFVSAAGNFLTRCLMAASSGFSERKLGRFCGSWQACREHDAGRTYQHALQGEAHVSASNQPF